jgi:hypothetical protein
MFWREQKKAVKMVSGLKSNLSQENVKNSDLLQLRKEDWIRTWHLHTRCYQMQDFMGMESGAVQRDWN